MLAFNLVTVEAAVVDPVVWFEVVPLPFDHRLVCHQVIPQFVVEGLVVCFEGITCLEVVYTSDTVAPSTLLTDIP